MKKIYLSLILLAAALFFNSCADSEYSDIYPKPSETSKASCDKLMTGVFYTGRTYTFNSYWRAWTWDNYSLGVYAQTVGFTNADGSIYAVGDSYANDRWVNFYNMLTQFRVLENVYNGLNENGKNTYRIFKDLAEVFVYDHLSQVIDIWGDVPFKKAGYLYITGDVAGSYPAYDKATELYGMMLTRLGELASDIGTLNGNLDAQAAAYLPGQDFINNGDLDKWERYANSLRLRLAVRVASQGTLAAEGKQVVAEILNGGKKLVENNTQTIQLPSNNDDTANFFNPDDLRTSYADGNYVNASQAMIDALTTAVIGENDPRLPILYSKNADGQYKGLSTHETIAEQQVNVDKPSAERAYSRIDSTTVSYNTEFISPILTASEVDFLRAEAYQQGWATGGDTKAKQSFIDGVLHSAQFYFAENAISPSKLGTTLKYPGDAAINTYATKAWEAATDKQAVIITQKWVNFGFIQPSQAWNEIRRTGYPSLYFPVDNGAQVLKNVPNRVKYPGSERSNNGANYNTQVESMGGDDSYYIKLFWAK
ncbi:SusD/RagB family nutrient-binding outer membrane lipoprotein [Bacteroidaceae bacterium HV4-6-C5C]|nr:SusD/RagB family nutrient-binding outer membrane lipoprotein [Bacteroidaceae bacterium HV4-6-C5C]